MKFEPLEYAKIGPQSILNLSKGLKKLLETHLWAKILAGLFLGIGIGIAIGPTTGWVDSEVSETLSNWLALPGQLFLALVQMVVVPLVFASVVRGISGGESIQQLKTLGISVAIYYVVTTAIAIVIGLSVTSVLNPGKYMKPEVVQRLIKDSPGEAGAEKIVEKREFKINELVPSLLPQNPLNAFADGQMMHIVLLALFMGVALMSLSAESARPVLEILDSLQQLSMVVIKWAMFLAPLAVFGLTTRLMSQLGWGAMLGLGFYVGTVIFGLILVMIFYLAILWVFVNIRPLKFMSASREVQLLAFSTSSSAAVMPLTIETAQKKLNVRSSVAQFLIPLGTTVNMNGTALYQGVATVFLAQVFSVDLTMAQLGLVVVTATMASIGAPGTPGVGMVILSMILASVGIPSGGIVLIMGVDRVLDMCRTVINVVGDLTAASVMNKLLPAKMA